MTTTRRTNRYHILINEILHRLPVKSLCRFKCVSKHLNSLISSPEFIYFHLNQPRHALDDVDHLFIFSIDPVITSKLCLYTSNLHECLTRPYTKMNKVPLPIRSYKDYSFFSFVGSCNGLHCTVRMPSDCLDILVCNPSTGIYKHVEVADLASPMTSNTFGFGFDDVNDDYKVVRVIRDSLNQIKTMDVMVYSLKTNSWRQAKNSRTSVSFPYHQRKEASVIDNHLLHWIIETPPGQLEIACLDICNEIWREDIVWPYSLVIGSRIKPQLGVIDGCLYVIFKIPSENKLDIWVMKEYRVNESWVKLFEISNQCLELPVDIIYDSPWRLKLLCYTNKSKDEILIWDDGISSLIWFDLKNNKVKTIKMNRGLEFPRLITAVYLCNGSLVNVPGGRPLQINKGFSFSLKEAFRIVSRRCTKGWLPQCFSQTTTKGN